jgi:thiamine-phosphate pyrophosphorylase
VTDRRTLSPFEPAEQLEPLSFEAAERREIFSFQSTERREILLRKIGAAASAGVHWIQIREKDLSGMNCGSLTREALLRAAKSPVAAAQLLAANPAKFSASKTVPVRILVNERLDVALSEGAGGVHLGEKSLPLAEAKRLTDSRSGSRDFLIGVSCHSLEDAKSAAAGSADYIFFGPVFATPSKAAFGEPQGLERLAEVCRAVTIPVLAIGGVTLENSSACLAAGASGIAAIRLFQEASNMSSIVQSLRKLNR